MPALQLPLRDMVRKAIYEEMLRQEGNDDDWSVASYLAHEALTTFAGWLAHHQQRPHMATVALGLEHKCGHEMRIDVTDTADVCIDCGATITHSPRY